MLHSLPPLQSRTLSSGLAQRTLRNLDFIKNSSDPNIHPVTQVVNSLLALLVFPSRKEKKFLAALPQVAFPFTSDCSAVEALVKQHLPLPSLKVTMFNNCENLNDFFRRLSNAISHKHLQFTGADPDSKVLSEVTVTLQDKPMKANAAFNWEISMTAADLEALSQHVAHIVIDLNL